MLVNMEAFLNVIDNTYYQMLANMYEAKGQSGQSNYEFDDESLEYAVADQ